MPQKSDIDYVRSLPCRVCGDLPSEPDHIKTRGAGGGDDIDNLQPLCREHHQERHTIGIKTFMNKYPQESDQEQAAKFIAQIYSVTSRKDGGGKIILEFGADALEQVQKIQRWNSLQGMNIAIAAVPYNQD